MCCSPLLRLVIHADAAQRCGDKCDQGCSLFIRGSSAHCNIMDDISHMGRIMAFASRVWEANRGRFWITLEQAKWYAKNIDSTIETEYTLTRSGHIPRRRFTFFCVEEFLVARPTSTVALREARALLTFALDMEYNFRHWIDNTHNSSGKIAGHKTWHTLGYMTGHLAEWK